MFPFLLCMPLLLFNGLFSLLVGFIPGTLGANKYGSAPWDSLREFEVSEWFAELLLGDHRRLRREAEQGDVDKQYRLATLYMYKSSGALSGYMRLSEGLKWLHKAAEQGCRWAQKELGDCYRKGIGVKQNREEALKWYLKIAEWWRKEPEEWYYPDILVFLACCYMAGEGVEQNDDEAVRLFRRAAEKGNRPGQICLGFCYLSGYGVEQNREEAMEWYYSAGPIMAQTDSSAAVLFRHRSPEDFLRDMAVEIGLPRKRVYPDVGK